MGRLGKTTICRTGEVTIKKVTVTVCDNYRAICDCTETFCNCTNVIYITLPLVKTPKKRRINKVITCLSVNTIDGQTGYHTKEF